jgi:hypothetical protein
MKKVKILLTLLTIIITVAPIAVQVLAYQDNLLGLIIPPQITDLMNGGKTSTDISGLANSPFQPPELSGQPQFFPETNTVKFTYNFTNPLNTPITITTLEAQVVCHEHGFPLGNVSIDPTTLQPGQTVDITAFGVLSPEAIAHIKEQHAGQSSINADFKNLNVDMGGVTIQMDQQTNIGEIPIPAQYLGWQ